MRYREAVDLLQAKGAVSEVAKQFEELASAARDTELAQRVQELALELRAMQDDVAPRVPSVSICDWSDEDKMAILKYELRNANSGYVVSDMRMSAFTTRAVTPQGAEIQFDVVSLLASLFPSHPQFLVGLLRDRRVTRVVSRGSHPDSLPVVLRFQDAAMEAMRLALPYDPFPVRSRGGYFSLARSTARETVVQSVQGFIRAADGLDGQDLLWTSVRFAPMEGKLSLLRTILGRYPRSLASVAAYTTLLHDAGLVAWQVDLFGSSIDYWSLPALLRDVAR